MAAGSSKDIVDGEIEELLLLDVDRCIPIVKENVSECSSVDKSKNQSSVPFCSALTRWGKSLEGLPMFTIKDIEKHRIESGKTPDTAIIKTLDRGRKFKEEKYISADSIFSRCDDDSGCFNLKAVCKASMKKDKRDVRVTLDKNTGVVYVQIVLVLLVKVAIVTT